MFKPLPRKYLGSRVKKQGAFPIEPPNSGSLLDARSPGGFWLGDKASIICVYPLNEPSLTFVDGLTTLGLQM